MNLLLVDDDPEIRLIAGIVLRNAGHRVIEASDAGEAAARVGEIAFDVVLMDVMLGDDDGIELAGRLLSDMPGARLIFLTGATRDPQMQRMAAAGPAGILHKPFDPLSLADRVQQILDPAGS